MFRLEYSIHKVYLDSPDEMVSPELQAFPVVLAGLKFLNRIEIIHRLRFFQKITAKDRTYPLIRNKQVRVDIEFSK